MNSHNFHAYVLKCILYLLINLSKMENHSLKYQEYQKYRKSFLEKKYVPANTRQNKCMLFYLLHTNI